MKNVYSFAHLAERPDFVDSATLHPKMETPPIWQPLADELESRRMTEEYPDKWWVWPLVTFVCTVAVCWMVKS